MKKTGIKKGDVIPQVNELRETTQKKKEDLNEIYNKARDSAFQYIISNAGKKMREAADQGKTRVYLYEWEYVEDRNSEKYRFEGIRILDIIRKSDLLDKLKEYFNPNNENDGYFVGFNKFKNTRQNEPNRYGIYISWQKKNMNKNNDSE